MKSFYLILSLIISNFFGILSDNCFFKIDKDTKIENNSGLIVTFSDKNIINCLNECKSQENCYVVLVYNQTCKLFDTTSALNFTYASDYTIYRKFSNPSFEIELIPSLEIDIKKTRSFVRISHEEVAVSSLDNQTYILNVTSKNIIKVLQSSTDSITQLAVLNEQFLVVVMDSKEILIWDIRNYTLVHTIETKRYFTTIVVLDNGEFVCGTKGGYLIFWDAITFNQTKNIPIELFCIYDLVKLQNGDLALSLGGNGSIQIFDMKIFNITKILDNHEDVVRMIVLPNGDLISGSVDRKLIIWNTINWTAKNIFQLNKSIFCFSLIRNNYLLVGLGNGEIRILNLVSKKFEHSWQANTVRIRSILVLNDSSLISGSDDEVNFWNFSLIRN
ncbi:unnamed protein product [Brachionus calyciflorus]|uniref:Uncharacterized protein n=1 Tax=Brachionus calyciflorus TaxID=104777 RepID=A0A813VG49_9BILA|nr:unnamed protein product [Brachionus calyciflorus]